MKTQFLTAFQVSAKVEGKSWMSKTTTVTAENETQAKTKAIEILSLCDEHEIKIEAVKVFNSGEKLSFDSYPYGRLRTTAYKSVEYKKGKGFRTVFQTICPKTGRINKPKNSTYAAVILPIMRENKFFDSCGWLSFNGTESINKGLYFMNDFFELFTTEQIKDIALTIYGMMSVDFKAQCIYCGTAPELLKPYFIEQLKNTKEIMNTGENLFLGSLLDAKSIEALKVPDFNPFTTV